MTAYFESNREILGFNDKWLIILGIPMISFVISVIFFSDQLMESPVYFFRDCMLVAFVHTLIYWMILRQVVIYLRRQFPKIEDVQKRIIRLGITFLVLYFALNPVIKLATMELLPSHEDIHGALPMFAAVLVNSALVLAIYECVYFYEQFRKSVIEREQLERANIQSQLEGLKNQVNPHFLFNSLNTLVYLIPENQKLAVRFVQKLSKVYRYILEIRDKKLIPLEEELEFLHAYIFLLKERFEENLQVSIEIPEHHLNSQIVPLSLQILIENAIKHNIISTERPLSIELFVEKDNRLVVKNKLQKKNQVMNSTKVGLENIKSRYSFFSQQPVEVLVTQASFMVILPLIHSKVLINS
ncbi:MAG: histidine kinase [Bacteroidota bacterium]